ncbi:MAG: hypothetical protein HFE76_01995 [Firmicutes bacterium]|nr:hypothetical protein [Bacillota bacterium]
MKTCKRIYNKKVFAFGVVMIGLGCLNLICDLVTDRIDVNGIILIVALFLFGSFATLRSLSRKLSREDKLDEMDERNQLIELKAKSRAFRLTQGTSFVLMLALLVLGKVSDYGVLLAIGAGLAFAFAISLFAEVFAFMYYEGRN